MTEDFVPSPSINSHTTPMDVQIPLIESSSHLNQFAPTNIIKSDPLSTPDKTFKNSNQNMIQSSSNKSKILKASDKLFNASQIKTLAFYQALLSEFLGTMLLTLVCTSAGLPITSVSVPDINGALASGLITATVIVGFGHVSGAHINPAVTLTLLVGSKIDLIRALFYIAMQLLGAISASGLLLSIVPPHARGNLGMTMITNGISLPQAFVVEFAITFILCYTVHAICDKKRDDIGGSKALAAGFAVTIGCLFGGPYTGGSMNPARSFGPAAIMNIWENHWIYWFGPFAGSITAGLVYTRILKKPSPIIVHNESHSFINKSNI